MKSLWIRLGIVAGVLAVIVAGASALADPSITRKDTFRCGKVRQDTCKRTCGERPYDNYGLCQDDRDGSTSQVTIECCCCTEGWQHRSFIGG